MFGIVVRGPLQATIVSKHCRPQRLESSMAIANLIGELSSMSIKKGRSATSNFARCNAVILAPHSNHSDSRLDAEGQWVNRVNRGFGSI
jgi:hypothetical protein